MAERHFEAQGASGKKFWTINQDDTRLTVRFGKKGTKGSHRTHSFDTVRQADNFAASIIEAKLRKGYVEVTQLPPAQAISTSSAFAGKLKPSVARMPKKVDGPAFMSLDLGELYAEPLQTKREALVRLYARDLYDKFIMRQYKVKLPSGFTVCFNSTFGMFGPKSHLKDIQNEERNFANAVVVAGYSYVDIKPALGDVGVYVTLSGGTKDPLSWMSEFRENEGLAVWFLRMTAEMQELYDINFAAVDR